MKKWRIVVLYWQHYFFLTLNSYFTGYRQLPTYKNSFGLAMF